MRSGCGKPPSCSIQSIRERLDAARFYPATDYIKALRIRSVLMDEMAAVLKAADVMVGPANGSLPGLLEAPEVAGTDVKPGSKSTAYRGGNTFLGNMTGLPALVLPCGFSAGPPRLPIGLQILRPSLRRGNGAAGRPRLRTSLHVAPREALV